MSGRPGTAGARPGPGPGLGPRWPAVVLRAGEVRAPTGPDQQGPELVVDIAELVWEPIAE